MQLPQIPSAFLYIIFSIYIFLIFFFLATYAKMKLRKGKERKIKQYLNVTFIIPAYNAAKLLGRTVDSIKKLRYPQEKIKIIIVNDGSKDNTLEIAEKIAKKYENISILTKENSGKADSLNYGLKRAKTELVAVLDADTLLKEDLLEKGVALFDGKTAAVTCSFKPLNNKKWIERMQGVEYALTTFYRMLVGHLKSLPHAPAFTIFRREFFVKHGYFDSGNLTEDFEMGLRIQSKHYDVGYVADSYAFTDVPDTIKKLYRQRVRWAYGGLYNHMKYKNLFFSKEYGDLGWFVVPSGYLTLWTVSISILLSIYSLISSINYYANLIMLGWVPSFSINIESVLFSFSDLKFLLFVFTIALGLFIYFLSRLEIDNKVPLFDYIITASVYFLLINAFCLAALCYYVTGKKPGW